MRPAIWARQLRGDIHAVMGQDALHPADVPLCRRNPATPPRHRYAYMMLPLSAFYSHGRGNVNTHPLPGRKKDQDSFSLSFLACSTTFSATLNGTSS